MIEWFIQLELTKQLLLIYLGVINIITFFYFGIDKLKAQLSHRRVPEKTLWILTIIGGTIGALAGMNFFRHKTKKDSFQIIIALILLMQIVLVYWIL